MVSSISESTPPATHQEPEVRSQTEDVSICVISRDFSTRDSVSKGRKAGHTYTQTHTQTPTPNRKHTSSIYVAWLQKKDVAVSGTRYPVIGLGLIVKQITHQNPHPTQDSTSESSDSEYFVLEFWFFLFLVRKSCFKMEVDIVSHVKRAEQKKKNKWLDFSRRQNHLRFPCLLLLRRAAFPPSASSSPSSIWDSVWFRILISFAFGIHLNWGLIVWYYDGFCETRRLIMSSSLTLDDEFSSAVTN